MCYEDRFFRRSVTKKQNKPEETKPVVERVPQFDKPELVNEDKRPKEAPATETA